MQTQTQTQTQTTARSISPARPATTTEARPLELATHGVGALYRRVREFLFTPRAAAQQPRSTFEVTEAKPSAAFEVTEEELMADLRFGRRD